MENIYLDNYEYSNDSDRYQMLKAKGVVSVTAISPYVISVTENDFYTKVINISAPQEQFTEWSMPEWDFSMLDLGVTEPDKSVLIKLP